MDDAGRKERIDALLAEALAALAVDMAPAGAPAAELLTPVSAIASRGKRMRALLLLTSYEACGGREPRRAEHAATALELFQTAALIHDDVLDLSDTRRGMSSTHRTLEGLHLTSGWSGDAARFGVNGAILAGDLALMACQRAMVQSVAGLPERWALAVSERFTSMASLCTAGQYLDIRLASQPLSDIGEQSDAIVATMRSKTASDTAEGPLAIGAALAGAEESAVDAWAQVGVPLGIAFQLRDDLLGVVGSPEATGKPAGDDLREGKRTLLLAHAMSGADAAGRATLLAVIGVDGASGNSVADAIDVIESTGAVDGVEHQIEDYAAQARATVERLGLDSPLRSRLDGLIDSTTRRTA